MREFNDFIYFYVPTINIKPAWYRFYFFVRKDLKDYKNLRNQVIQKLRKKKIVCNFGSCPEIYLEKAFKNSKFKLKKRLKNSKILGETSIALDINHTLTKKQVLLNSKKFIQQSKN